MLAGTILLFSTIFFTTLLATSHVKSGWFGASSSSISKAKLACEAFIKKEFKEDTYIFDTWEKGGKIVVEVGYREKKSYRSRDDNTYSTRLCVYDEDDNSYFSPGAFGRGKWDK